MPRFRPAQPALELLKGVLGLGYAAETWGADVILTASKAVSDKSTNSFKAPGYGITFRVSLVQHFRGPER